MERLVNQLMSTKKYQNAVSQVNQSLKEGLGIPMVCRTREVLEKYIAGM